MFPCVSETVQRSRETSRHVEHLGLQSDFSKVERMFKDLGYHSRELVLTILSQDATIQNKLLTLPNAMSLAPRTHGFDWVGERVTGALESIP